MIDKKLDELITNYGYVLIHEKAVQSVVSARQAIIAYVEELKNHAYNEGITDGSGGLP